MFRFLCFFLLFFASFSSFSACYSNPGDLQEIGSNCPSEPSDYSGSCYRYYSSSYRGLLRISCSWTNYGVPIPTGGGGFSCNFSSMCNVTEAEALSGSGKYKLPDGSYGDACPVGYTPDQNRVCQPDSSPPPTDPPPTDPPPTDPPPADSCPSGSHPNPNGPEPACIVDDYGTIPECGPGVDPSWCLVGDCPPGLVDVDPTMPGAQCALPPPGSNPPGGICDYKPHSFWSEQQQKCVCEIGYQDIGSACILPIQDPPPDSNKPPVVGSGPEGSGGEGTGGSSGEGGGGSAPPSGGGSPSPVPGSPGPVGSDPDGDPGTDDVPQGGGSSGWGTVPGFERPNPSFANDPKIQDSILRMSNAWNSYAPVQAVHDVMSLSFTPSALCPEFGIDTGQSWFGYLHTDAHCQVIEPKRVLIQNFASIAWVLTAVFIFLSA